MFDSSERFAIIYSSDADLRLQSQATHVKHRNFTQWVDTMKSEWKLINRIPNNYPYTGDTKKVPVLNSSSMKELTIFFILATAHKDKTHLKY